MSGTGVGTQRGRTIAVFRRALLPASETFIARQALGLDRYAAVFAGDMRVPGLDLPEGRVLVGTPGGRWTRAVRRRLPGHDPLRRLQRGCRARDVALVHAHFGTDAIAALPLAHGLGVPLVVTFHGFDATLTDDALRAGGGVLAEYLEARGRLFEQATLLLAVSRFLADELRARGAPDAKLRVHHGGVTLGPRPDHAPEEPVVLFIGRHIEKKGLGDLLQAMARVRRAVSAARLVVVGDGPLRARYEREARELDSGAEFVGWLAPGQVREQLRRVRLLCVPSRRAADGDAEGLPTVIAEAGAEGVPVVGTRHSGIPEAVVDGTTGLLTDEGDVDGLADGIVALLGDDALWRRLSDGAHRHIAERFDAARQIAALERLYDEALA